MALASTVSCHTKLFVYQHLRPNVSLSLRSLRPYYSPPGSPDLDCLRGSCAYSTFYPASRVYTSEVPLFRALISRCPLVKDAAEADLFIVPSMLATIATCFWGLNKTQGAALKAQGAQGQQLTRALYDQLPHLSSQTARRHVFFWTVDADWVSPDGQVGVPPELSGPMHDAIYIHLGDDHYRGPAWHRLKGIKGGRYMTRDVVVPYRITQWLPFGFPPPRLPARLLINANVNLHRHAVRRSFGKALDVAARARGIRWRVMLPQAGRNQSVDDKVAGSMLDDVRQASNDTLSSTFCLCPTGDAKGLTARFYHSIVHGCIPVRVVTAPGPEPCPLAYPSPRSPAWSRLASQIMPSCYVCMYAITSPAWEHAIMLCMHAITSPGPRLALIWPRLSEQICLRAPSPVMRCRMVGGAT